MSQNEDSKYKIKISDWLIFGLIILTLFFSYIVTQNLPLRIVLIGPKNYSECLYLVKDARTSDGAKAVIAFCRRTYDSDK